MEQLKAPLFHSASPTSALGGKGLNSTRLASGELSGDDVRRSTGSPRAITSGYIRGKRILDVGLTSFALLLLAPLMCILAMLIRVTSRGPILFRQTRIGQDGREFEMLKFRSMYAGVDDQAHREMNVQELLGNRSPPGASGGLFRISDDDRVTQVGYWLRRYSVDELPQLLNVLRGEMSLVGPRPSLPWEVELYTPEQRRRHECLPGITGLWQVSNRYSLSMPEMLALDLYYRENRSLRLDLCILLRTPNAILLDRSTR